jgi:hypothetical protein
LSLGGELTESYSYVLKYGTYTIIRNYYNLGGTFLHSKSQIL